MEKREGKIVIQKENLKDLIKKFRYADHDIFVRELLNNAVAAIGKLNSLKGVKQLSANTIIITINDIDKTISFKDNGIGMTESEMLLFINQIPFSGAKLFKSKHSYFYSHSLGEYGVGFYSSFLVSKKVEIKTKSYKKKYQAIKWSCSACSKYEIENISRVDVGTEIILHIAEDSKEFLSEKRINQLLNIYSKFNRIYNILSEHIVLLPIEVRLYKNNNIVSEFKLNC